VYEKTIFIAPNALNSPYHYQQHMKKIIFYLISVNLPVIYAKEKNYKQRHNSKTFLWLPPISQPSALDI